MMSTRRGIKICVALSTFGVIACGGAPEARAPVPVPESVCAKINEELPKLSVKGGLVFDSPTSLTMDRAAWSRLGTGARNQFVQTIALAAICGGDRILREQEVTIRADDGVVMMQRVVEFNEAPTLD